MTATATKIRRNADGQQNLIDLRRALAESPHMVYSQGGDWIVSIWSDVAGAFLTHPMGPWAGERQAIQKALGLDVESKDHAAMFARR